MPYVPTPQVVVERMLEIAKVGPDDYVIDLGSGDGRIVVTAAKKFGARGFGVDLNPTRIDEANENARKAGVTDKVAFYQRDLFETDLDQASVITMYLLPRVNLELRPKILDLKPGTRIVSHDFSMDDWKPDLHEELEAKDKYGGSGGRSDIYFWIVPAKVAGTWQSQLQVRGTSDRVRVHAGAAVPGRYGHGPRRGEHCQPGERENTRRSAQLRFDGGRRWRAGEAHVHRQSRRRRHRRNRGPDRAAAAGAARLEREAHERRASAGYGSRDHCDECRKSVFRRTG